MIARAIYTDPPPSNVFTIPQSYTVHCLALCGANNVTIISENTLDSLISSLTNSTTNTSELCDYSAVVQWDPDDTPHTGNPIWKCVARIDTITETLQTYIRGNMSLSLCLYFNIVCIVPAAAPSNLMLLNNDSVLSWTPLDGVCGYVVYAYSLMNEESSTLFVSNNTYNVTQDAGCEGLQ